MKNLSIVLLIICCFTSCKVRQQAKKYEKRKIVFAERQTDSGESLVIIKYAETVEDIYDAESDYLTKKLGEENKTWELIEQSYLVVGASRLDVFKIHIFEPDTIYNINFDLKYFQER